MQGGETQGGVHIDKFTNSSLFPCKSYEIKCNRIVLYLPLKFDKVANTNTISTKFSKETYLYWYELMLLLRRFEEKTGQLYGMQKIRGFCHLYIGQEALAAGCMTATKPEDSFITAYRDHGLAIAKGITAKACMAEL